VVLFRGKVYLHPEKVTFTTLLRLCAFIISWRRLTIWILDSHYNGSSAWIELVHMLLFKEVLA
jgi:hypothetical protein